MPNPPQRIVRCLTGEPRITGESGGLSGHGVRPRRNSVLRPARCGNCESLEPPPNPTEARLLPNRIPMAVPARSRKLGGRHRAGQRSAGRNPPNPKVPVDLALVLSALDRTWKTRKRGYPNLWRVRALAAITVALAVSPGTTCRQLCAMRPRDLARLVLPPNGRRWVRRWLRIRRDWVPGADGELVSWLAIPPASNGTAQQIQWAVVQTLHRAGVPAWRLSALLRVPRLRSSRASCP